MSETYTVTGTYTKKEGTTQLACESYSMEYTGAEESYVAITLAEIDAAELSDNNEVYAIDMNFINTDPPTNGEVKLIVIDVLTSDKRVEVKFNVPTEIVTAMEAGTPADDAVSGDFSGVAYTDIDGVLVTDTLILGGKVSNIYINRFPLLKTGHDVDLDSDDCRVAIKVIGG
jgi:hypothetical protein